MIIFLSFAPIQFMGGFERWVYNLSKKITKKEEVKILNVSNKISNIYGRIVLKREFDDRTNKTHISGSILLDAHNFVPFTQNWRKTRKLFKTARIVYIKYEVLEVFILIYFLGFRNFQKVVAGLHTPFIYRDPQSVFDRFHKFIYESAFSRWMLKKMKLIHVINKRDHEFLTQNFLLQNIIYVPNGIKQNLTRSKSFINTSKGNLNILFIGELSIRKGTDILLEVIKDSPKNFIFEIVGDGPMKKDVEEIATHTTNCRYVGYINKNIQKYYLKNDVLFIPSRAEGMPLVILEAMSYGLQIVDSENTTLKLPKYIEHVNDTSSPKTYLRLFQNLYNKKQDNLLDRRRVVNFLEKNFLEEDINQQLLEKIFI